MAGVDGIDAGFNCRCCVPGLALDGYLPGALEDLAAQRDPALDAIVGGERLFVELSNAWFAVLGPPMNCV